MVSQFFHTLYPDKWGKWSSLTCAYFWNGWFKQHPVTVCLVGGFGKPPPHHLLGNLKIFIPKWEKSNFIINSNKKVHSGSLTWQWKFPFSNRKLIYKWWIFYGYVRLPEGILLGIFSWFYREQPLSSPRGICFPKSRIPNLAWVFFRGPTGTPRPSYPGYLTWSVQGEEGKTEAFCLSINM